MYQLAPDIDGDGPAKAVPYPREDLTVRGVPAAFFDQDSRLELYTGSVTVVLFGTGRNRLLSAAAALHGATEDVTPSSLQDPSVTVGRCPPGKAGLSLTRQATSRYASARASMSASTTAGSNWVPLQRRSSAIAFSSLSAGR